MLAEVLSLQEFWNLNLKPRLSLLLSVNPLGSFLPLRASGMIVCVNFRDGVCLAHMKLFHYGIRYIAIADK